MGVTRVIQNALNSGELSPRLSMREDYERYANGLKTLRNFQPLPSGGVMTQYGQQWIAQTKDAALAYLWPFEFSTTQAYVIEAGNLYFRFYRNGGRIVDLTGTITGAANNGAGLIRITDVAHGLTTGNYVYITGVVGTDEANGEWVVTVIDPDTFDLQGSVFTNTYTSGGTWSRPYEITTPYALADLPTVKFTQSADTLYLVHPLYAPRKLTRTGHTAWQLNTIDFVDGPYLDDPGNYTKITLTPSAATGDGITITAGPAGVITNATNNGSGLIRITDAAHGYGSGAKLLISGVTGTTEANGTWTISKVNANTYDLLGSAFVNAYIAGGASVPSVFASTDVGRLVRMKEGSVWGYAVITAFTTVDVVTANVENTLTDATSKSNWRLGAWSVTTGYPSAITLFEQRLCFAATSFEPQRIWMSTTGSYEDMSPSATGGTVADSDAVTFQLGSNKVNKIQWLSGARQLYIGTIGEEFSLEGSEQKAVSAVNPPIVRSGTTEGSADLAPLRIGNRIIFVQRSGRELRELSFTETEQNLTTEELSLIADHFLRSPHSIVTLAYQNKPNRMVWGVRSDGALLAFCNYIAEKVRAWALMGSEAASGIYKWVTVIPSVDLLDDQAWFIVRRTIGGVQKHFVEMQNQSTSVHCGLTYSGAPVTAVSGLDHLNGQTVRIVGDGAVYDNQVVSRGSVTLAYGASTGPAASTIHVGLPITPNPSASTLQPSLKDQAGSARHKLKHWASLAFELENTLGLTINGKTQIQYRKPSDPMDAVEPSFTGTKKIANLGWSHDGSISWEQTLPLPATVLGYSGELDIGD